MKEMIFFILFGLPVIANAQGYWTEICHMPSDSDYYKPLLSIPDSQTIWAATVTATGDEIIHRWHLSTDGGATWTQGDIAMGNTTQGVSSFHAISATKAFAAMHPSYVNEAGGIWKTENAGATWTQIPNLFQTPGYSFPNVIHFYNEQNGTIIGDPENGCFEIYNTSNGGTTWIRVASENIAAPLETEYGYIEKASVNGNTIRVETNKGRILSSVDAGATWTASNTPAMDFSGMDFFDFDFKNQTDGILIRYGHEHYATTNAGATWQLYFPAEGTNLTIRDRSIWSIPNSNGSYFATGNDFNTGDEGSSYSSDNGITWYNMNLADINPIIPVSVLFLDQDNAFAIGTYLSEEHSPANYKLFRHGTGNPSVDDLLKLEQFQFGANVSAYPNPAKEKVTISAKKITGFELYDVTGKQIYSQHANQTDTITIATEHLETGIYFGKITTLNGSTGNIKIVRQ